MPSTMTWPRSGLIRPTSDLRNTVFPVPDGPSMTLTSPGGRDSETSRHTTWCPKDFVSPSTTTSMPISPPWVTYGDDNSPPCQPVTFRIGVGIFGRPWLSQPTAPMTLHSSPCVSRLKFWGPEIAALKIGSRFSPTPQCLKGGIVTVPVSGTPLTFTLPGTIRADSRENTVATLLQVRNLLGWQGMKGLTGPTTKMLIVPCSISSIVAVVGTKPNVRNVAVDGGNWCSLGKSSWAAFWSWR